MTIKVPVPATADLSKYIDFRFFTERQCICLLYTNKCYILVSGQLR